IRVIRRDGGGAWQSIDLSEGGCFISGGPLLERGEQLELTFMIGAEEFNARAQVAWINANLSRRLPPGMGLQFIEIDDGSRHTLQTQLLRIQDELPELTGELSEQPGAPLPNGTQLGPYTTIQLLGSGGMGGVYLCERDGARVAVKTLHEELATDPMIVRR